MHEEQLRQILDVAPDAIMVSDQDRKIELVNKEAEAMFGYTRAQMIGLDMLIVVPPRLHRSFTDRRSAMLAASDSGKERAERESFSVRHDGSEFPVVVRHQVATLAGRKVIVSAIRDITEQRAAAQRLMESEARLRVLLDSAPDAIVVSELDGAIRVVNAATEAMLGHGRGQLIGQSITVITAPQRQSLMMENRRKLIERYRSGDRALDERESVVRTREGREFPVRLRQTVTTVDGRPMLLSVIRDISEGQAQQRAIAESEARFRLLSESAPDAIVVSDYQGRIVMVNGEAEKLFRSARAELIGVQVQTLTPERLRADLIEVRRMIFARAEAGESIPPRETFARRSDGSEFPIAARHSVAEMDGRKIMISALRDISDQRAARQKIEELNERLKRDNAALAAVNGELEAFSYSVSHDLRTPLRAIDGFSQALVEDCADKLDEAGRSHLERIRGATQRMALLIDDLLKLARVTRGELNVGDVDLSAIAGEVVRDLRERAPGRAVEIAIAPGLAARGDARLMRVALENLLANAWKFTDGRTPARIEFGRTGDNGDAAYYVRDNGAGFDMAYAGKLFGAFQRLHDAGKFPGAGIGLATVQRVIRKHGGRIWTEAATDKGATFFFTL